MTNDTAAAKRIVVGVDGSPCSILALQRARPIADASQWEIDAVAAWQYPSYLGAGIVGELHPDDDARKFLHDAVEAAFGSDRPEGLEEIVTHGYPSQVLIEASAEAEMLVVGSRGHGGFVGLLLGSVSGQCAEHAQCPVLVVHSGDHH
ncbi:UspA domain-containing protein [Rhodococcus sp. AW25M09]|uniref:universal stress protein n=1 Tax=Rhodococcus sp. AW25M09 TaxID=1268303 RepID=UPI0002ABE2E9|nr:universal stress protein [Rhodococcus sp. AW25M09]CCQ13545.1 UspA domain-containing protein [Rhodococcus sp. AW25M09]